MLSIIILYYSDDKSIQKLQYFAINHLKLTCCCAAKFNIVILSTPRANCVRPTTAAPIPKAAESSKRASDRSS